MWYNDLMGKKERIQKELDLLLEKIRFWRYVILAIISGLVGMLFAASQHKLILGLAVSAFFITGFIGILIAIKRLGSIDLNYKELLNELEKVK